MTNKQDQALGQSVSVTLHNSHVVIVTVSLKPHSKITSLVQLGLVKPSRPNRSTGGVLFWLLSERVGAGRVGLACCEDSLGALPLLAGHHWVVITVNPRGLGTNKAAYTLTDSSEILPSHLLLCLNVSCFAAFVIIWPMHNTGCTK